MKHIFFSLLIVFIGTHLTNAYVTITDLNGNGINDEIDAAILINTDKTLFIPSGGYEINRPIYVPNGWTLIGDNVRETGISTSSSFSGDAMIKNFPNDDPTGAGKSYITISNLTLTNNEVNHHMVILWLAGLWETSSVKNITIRNWGIIRGAFWHSLVGPGWDYEGTAEGGGQFIVENLNVFGAVNTTSSYCYEEIIKLRCTGGLWCRNWNINPFGTRHYRQTPYVSLYVTTAILSAKEIHIEGTPGNGFPSLEVECGSNSMIDVTNCDIRSTEATPSTSTVAIEVSPDSTYYNTEDFNIENIVLKYSSDAFFTDPIKIRKADGTYEVIPDDMTYINRLTKTVRQFDDGALRYYSRGEGELISARTSWNSPYDPEKKAIFEVKQESSDGMVYVRRANGSIISKISGDTTVPSCFMSGVGIGTTTLSSSAKLDVNGNINVASSYVYKVNGTQVVGTRKTAVPVAQITCGNDVPDFIYSPNERTMLNHLKADVTALRAELNDLVTKLSSTSGHGLLQ